MKTHKRLKWAMVGLAGMLLTFIACNGEDELQKENEVGETKTITWEQVLAFERGFMTTGFDVSDDGRYIFYATTEPAIYRYDLQQNEQKLLHPPHSGANNRRYYVHLIDGVLYTILMYNNNSYFGISTDMGETITEHHVAEHIPFEAHNKFLFVQMNRLFKMPDGTLVLPDVPGADEFALSRDGGLNWSRKASDFTFIPAQQGTRLYALELGWEGDFGIGGESKLFTSDDMGTSWQPSDLKFMPQSVDREGNLIASDSYQIQRLKNGTWTLYEWEGNSPWSEMLVYFNDRGTTIQTTADIEFDASNTLYLLGGNSENGGIYKARLE